MNSAQIAMTVWLSCVAAFAVLTLMVYLAWEAHANRLGPALCAVLFAVVLCGVVSLVRLIEHTYIQSPDHPVTTQPIDGGSE